VRPGDALRLVADVIEVRRSEKRPTLGILRWRWRLFNQRESDGARRGSHQSFQARSD
jgi:acyl dehydratase